MGDVYLSIQEQKLIIKLINYNSEFLSTEEFCLSQKLKSKIDKRIMRRMGWLYGKN